MRIDAARRFGMSLPMPRRYNPPPSDRRGAAMVELAIVFPVFLILVIGVIDLTTGVYRYNLVSEAARRGVREAIVLGEDASPQRASLGPQTWTGTAASGDPVADAIRPLLAAIDPAEFAIRLEWPDGNNLAPSRVRCTVSTVFRPFSFVLVGQTVNLSATSTMSIAN